MRKHFAKFVEFSVDEMYYASQQFKELLRNSRKHISIIDSKLHVRHRTGRSLDNIGAVSESDAESPGISIRHHSQQLDIPRSTMHRILTKDLHLHACKNQLTQEFKPTDHVQRLEFVNWVLENQKVDSNFSKKIIFSDEAHFQLYGCVNTKNCPIRGAENPRVIHKKPL